MVKKARKKFGDTREMARLRKEEEKGRVYDKMDEDRKETEMEKQK